MSHKFAGILVGVENNEGEARRQLTAARMSRRLSMRDAAALAGCSDATWRHLESGYHTPAKGLQVPYVPATETIVKAALAVGLDPSEMLGLYGREQTWTRSSAPLGLGELVSEARAQTRDALRTLDQALALIGSDRPDDESPLRAE